MKRVNLFYLAMIVISLALIYLFLPERETEVSFFGFAENQQTEINYNYAVMVEEIFITPGQEIEQGAPLIKLIRKRSKESLVDEPYKIVTVRREMEAWKQKKESELTNLKLKYEEAISEMSYKIEKLEQEIIRDKKLKAQFYSNGENNPVLLAQKDRLQTEKALLEKEYSQKKSAIANEKESGLQPFQSKIAELEAKQVFEETHQEESILVKAPLSGLIGNINCREGEHIPAFKTLMTFYEPHSSLVKGYIHEESLMEIGDSARFVVSSLLQEDMNYPGKLVGMGSRIVEIPTRLRKFEQIKTYGREITIEIPSDNNFIQKEKVGVKLINED